LCLRSCSCKNTNSNGIVDSHSESRRGTSLKRAMIQEHQIQEQYSLTEQQVEHFQVFGLLIRRKSLKTLFFYPAEIFLLAQAVISSPMARYGN